MKDFIGKIKELENNPVALQSLLNEITDEYATVSYNYEKLIPEIAQKKKELMEMYPKITEANKRYDISEIGQREDIIKIRLKTLEKLMSTIKRQLQSYAEEARNQY